MNHQPLSEYLRNKEIRNNLRYTCSPERRGYVLAGSCIISDEQVNEMYPIANDRVTLWNYYEKGSNPDKSHV